MEKSNYMEVIEIEFPSISFEGKFYSLDLKTEVSTRTYKKCFVKDYLCEAIVYDNHIKEMCWVERWFIKNNPKYDYIWKEEKPLSL